MSNEVPKPEGFDLREKRAAKTDDAELWTAEDAIYSTFQRIKGKDITQLVVYWWERHEDGAEYLHYTNATSDFAEHAFLLQKGLNHLLTPKK